MEPKKKNQQPETVNLRSNLSSDATGSARYFDQALRIITQLIHDYDGTIPLHRFLKSQFRAHRSFGSRDRKIYSDWIYSWFRMGKALAETEFNKRITVARYLTGGLNHGMIEEAADRFLDLPHSVLKAEKGTTDRIRIIGEKFPEFDLSQLFPFREKISAAVNRHQFFISHIQKPLVWIRPFPDQAAAISNYCTTNSVDFFTTQEMQNAIGFPQAFNIEQLPFRKGIHYEIQDLASQICGASVPAISGELWWDCCCGAGGKSLQLLHRIPGIRIHATDVRASVIENFRERIPGKLVKQVSLKVADLTVNSIGDNHPVYDGILADVPCTGSGTWSRNPENLTFFNEQLLPEFRKRQEQIVTTALHSLKSGGTLVYMTCSVFASENEEMVAFILQKPGLHLLRSELVKGYEFNSDSMFYAVFSKS